MRSSHNLDRLEVAFDDDRPGGGRFRPSSDQITREK